MQVPTRRAQQLKKRDDRGEEFLTPDGLARLKRDLERLTSERPDAIGLVQRLAQLGDFSENVEYQEAKYQLRRINDRMERLKDRLLRAVIIEPTGGDGNVRLGSIVTVRAKNKETIFEIVGPRESNPSRGRISHLSPLGAALIGQEVGQTVIVQTSHGPIKYEIVKVT